MQAKRKGICIVPTTVHRKKKQQLLSPFLFCLGAVWEGGREGREVQRGGGGRWSKVGLPHKWNHWQRSRFILCSSELSMPLSVCIRWESACTCVFQHSLVSLIPNGCLSMLSCQQLVQQSAGEKQNWTW